MTPNLSNVLLEKYHYIFAKANQDNNIKKHIQHHNDDGFLELNFATSLKRNETLPEKKVLFVGINPSYRLVNQGKQDFNASSLGNGSNDYFYYPFSLSEHILTDPYFPKIRKLIADAHIDINQCGYLDLFVHRRTE
jgi:hypothetical protein